MLVKSWGAGGGSDDAGVDTRGGAGGYSTALFSVNSGDSYTAMVGQAAFGSGNYGFGGAGTFDGAGGGLSGLFNGCSGISATDSSLAMLIAGGGGGVSTNGATIGDHAPSGNQLLRSGGQSTMQGQHSAVDGTGGGGGGYNGGNSVASANSGTGFINPIALHSQMSYSPIGDLSPSNSSDSDYVSNGGNAGRGGSGPPLDAGTSGLLIIYWY